MQYSKIILTALALILISIALFMMMTERQVEKPEHNITPPFSIGEQLIYNISLINSSGSFFICTVNLSVIGLTSINGCECYVLRGEYVGLGLKAHSYVTTNNLTLMKTVIEAPSAIAVVTYNHKIGKGTITVTTENDFSSQQVDIKPDTQDPLSSIYYIRSLPLREGYWCTFNQISVEGLALVRIIVSNELKNVQTGLGNFTCYEVLLESGGAKSMVYISTSSERLPVIIKIPFSRDTYQCWELVKYLTPTLAT